MPTSLRTGAAAAASRAAAMLGDLGSINVPKSCDVLAERLQQQILSGDYTAGAALPTERELVLTTGLGRGSVREALRILEAQGLVRTRAGRYGGSVVARPTDALLATHISLFARGNSVSLRALVEARQALEPMVAYLAARNRSAADLATLKAISARIDQAAVDDVPRFLQENAHWHTALAAASHNDLLRAFTASISAQMFEASRLDKFASPEVRSLVTHAHRRILQTIEAQDADLARSRAERDLQAYETLLEAAVRETLAAAAVVNQLAKAAKPTKMSKPSKAATPTVAAKGASVKAPAGASVKAPAPKAAMPAARRRTP